MEMEMPTPSAALISFIENCGMDGFNLISAYLQLIDCLLPKIK
jgi:hypothetical protein